MSAPLSSSVDGSQSCARNMAGDWRKEACWTSFLTTA